MKEQVCAQLCSSCEHFGLCLKRAAANDNDQRVPANDNDEQGIIFLPSDSRLRKAYFVHRLAICLQHLLPVSRHALPDHLSELIWNYDGIIIGIDGRQIDQLEIDVWDELDVDADPGLRWFDGLLDWSSATPKLAPRQSQMRRLRLLFLALSILNRRVACRLL